MFALRPAALRFRHRACDQPSQQPCCCCKAVKCPLLAVSISQQQQQQTPFPLHPSTPSVVPPYHAGELRQRRRAGKAGSNTGGGTGAEDQELLLEPRAPAPAPGGGGHHVRLLCCVTSRCRSAMLISLLGLKGYLFKCQNASFAAVVIHTSQLCPPRCHLSSWSGTASAALSPRKGRQVDTRLTAAAGPRSSCSS